MTEMVAIVEGQTEQTFVRDQLAVHLVNHGVNMWAVLPGKSRKHGGVRRWDGARGDIIRTLREGRYCTTMFDFYQMPVDWPGRRAAVTVAWEERAKCVQDAILEDVAEQMGSGFDRRQLLVYVQLHEFEALAFADPVILAEKTAPLSHLAPERLAEQFQRIVADAGEPEAIDDGYETCPSRRIQNLVRGYRKRLVGPIVTQAIGLAAIRKRCGHFSQWLARLEQLGSG